MENTILRLFQEIQQFLLSPGILAISRRQTDLVNRRGRYGLGLPAPLPAYVGQNGSNLSVVEFGCKPWHQFPFALLSLKNDSAQGVISSLNPVRFEQRILHPSAV